MVGTHLMFHLLTIGSKVKAIYRAGSNLERVKDVFGYYTSNADELFRKILWVEADITDIPSLENAFNEVSEVYHCAALISFDPGDFYQLRKVNEEGTGNLVNLCIERKIQKLCYLSSIATIGKSLDETIATEDSDWTDQNVNVYALSKHLAEMEVWRGSQEGLPVVILNPGIILGPGFWHRGSGVFFKIAARAPRYYPPGGMGFITVNDVVRLMVKLMKSSIKNERFITIDKNLSYLEILSAMAVEYGKKPPSKVLKNWQLQLLWRIDWMRNKITGKKRRLTRELVIAQQQGTLYSNDKIKSMIDHENENMGTVISFCCNQFREAYPSYFY